MVYYSYAGIAIKEIKNLVLTDVPISLNYNMYVLQCSRIVEFILKHALVTECGYSYDDLKSIHRLAILLRLLRDKFGDVKSILGDISVLDNVTEDLSQPDLNFYWTSREDYENVVIIAQAAVNWYINNSDIHELYKVFVECTNSDTLLKEFTEIPNDTCVYDSGRRRMRAMFKLPFN